jgi:multidrug efflux system membrane fusion protein
MLNQTRPILVRFAIPAGQLPIIRRFQNDSLRVRAGTGQGDQTLEGVLVFVDNAVDTTTGTIMLKARFDNAGGTLWPGQFVTATAVVYQEQGVVMVPVPAVVEGEGGNFVYVVGADSTANTRPVTVGRTVGDMVVVVQGLEPGETVVTDGQLRLVPGARVSVRRTQR